MPYIEGHSFHYWLNLDLQAEERMTLTAPVRLQIIQDMAKGVAHLHSLGLEFRPVRFRPVGFVGFSHRPVNVGFSHRPVNTKNILLDSNKKARLGISSSTIRDNLGNTTVVTLPWRPGDEDEFQKKNDVSDLGNVMELLLTGRLILLPHGVQRARDLLQAFGLSVARDIADPHADFSEPMLEFLCTAVLGCTVSPASERWSAESLLRALDVVISGLNLTLPGAAAEATHASNIAPGAAPAAPAAPARMCMVCLAAARAALLPCGHFVTCEECTLQLTQCPICRESFVFTDVTLGTYPQTFVREGRRPAYAPTEHFEQTSAVTDMTVHGRAMPAQVPQVQPSRIAPPELTFEDVSAMCGGFSLDWRLTGAAAGRSNSGQGVYRGNWTRGARSYQVAIKLVDSVEGDSQELQMMLEYRHPMLVPLLCYAKDSVRELCALVMPYMEGSTLEFWLSSEQNRRRLTGAARLWVIRNTVGGLLYLHTATAMKPQVVHRDVKTENILLDGDMNARLGDLGISRNLQHVVTITRVAGTRYYLDPEYHQTQHLSTASDIYSLGRVMLQLLTGKKIGNILCEMRDRPEDEIWGEDIVNRLQTDGLSAARDIADPHADFSDPMLEFLCTAVLECTKSPASERWSAESLLRALDVVLSGLNLTPPGAAAEATHASNIAPGAAPAAPAAPAASAAPARMCMAVHGLKSSTGKRKPATLDLKDEYCGIKVLSLAVDKDDAVFDNAPILFSAWQSGMNMAFVGMEKSCGKALKANDKIAGPGGIGAQLLSAIEEKTNPFGDKSKWTLVVPFSHLRPIDKDNLSNAYDCEVPESGEVLSSASEEGDE
ncbi:hypothetical protein CYMTET_16502 [Cymbomonas tetramitiformis]|uniref:Protein kinase domain-containing protein n=1 Tax=Cymbomonas tetramitiformis TaxID=36881 RepID=A0AAE0GC32_9CHLO|nr:hypothetical protein CYMTET_16502 [Cymbomonas tetramitiformis]